jgi:ribosome maturation factor RimP
MAIIVMTHPLVPLIFDLATPIASDLGLEIISVVFQTNQRPPVLRVDIRNCSQDTGLTDCEQMSRALEAALDTHNLIPDAYVLEVSSPGTSRTLTTDRELAAFKGFEVVVQTTEPFEGKQTWLGRLVGRDETAVHLNQKGRAIAIPRTLVTQIQLDS